MDVQTQRLGNILVAREDLLAGGTKSRFLPALAQGETELVYGGPFCGGAALALAAVGRALRIPVTLFYAQRKAWHPRQLLAQSYGATLVPVPMGFQTNVSAKARQYAEARGARHFQLGYDLPEAHARLLEQLAHAKKRLGGFEAIYLACGSGMLAACLSEAWPSAEVVACCVGLKSHWSKKPYRANVRTVEWPTGLATPAPGPPPPFPCCPYYEQKAWAVLQRERPKGRVLFWNVLGDPRL